MNFWVTESSPLEEQHESKMADHTKFGNRLRKTLYYGEYSDASQPSMSVTDVAVEVLNNAVTPQNRFLDRKFAHGVTRRAKISPCTLMMGMLYVERLRQQNRLSPTKELSSSDIFLISIMVASKYLYDEGEEEEVYNEDWAKAGLKSIHELNKLEMEFLHLMDWNLFIKPKEFHNFVNKIESQIAANKGCARGWLTYTDLETLLNNNKLQQTLSSLTYEALKAMSTCIATYLLGISLLLSTSALACLQLQPPQGPNMTPVAHPTANCLTSDASCLFSRFDVHVRPSDPENFMPVAARRPRTKVISSQMDRNEEGTRKIDVIGGLQTANESKNRVSLFPPVAYHLERFQGTSITLPAFTNFTITFKTLQPIMKTRISGNTSYRDPGHGQNDKISKFAREPRNRHPANSDNKEQQPHNSINRTGILVAPKCKRKAAVCMA